MLLSRMTPRYERGQRPPEVEAVACHTLRCVPQHHVHRALFLPLLLLLGVLSFRNQPLSPSPTMGKIDFNGHKDSELDEAGLPDGGLPAVTWAPDGTEQYLSIFGEAVGTKQCPSRAMGLIPQASSREHARHTRLSLSSHNPC
jgi:hypothetical protein